MLRVYTLAMLIALVGTLSVDCAAADEAQQSGSSAGGAVTDAGEHQLAARDPESKGPAATDAANQDELRKLYDQMREKAQAHQKARESGDEEKAEQLRGEMRELREKIAKRMPEGAARWFMLQRPSTAAGRPNDNPAVAAEHRELMQKMMTKYQQLRKLKEAGKKEEAEQVQKELEQMRSEFAKAAMRQRGGPQANWPQAARPAHLPDVFGRVMQLRREIKAAEGAGDEQKAAAKKDELWKMVDKMADRMAAMHGGGGPAAHDFRKPQPSSSGWSAVASDRPAEVQRFQHLRMAAANLDAAGLPEYAAKVRAESERMAAAMKQRAAGGDADAGMQELRQHVRRLTEEVRRLRSRVDELSK